MSPPARSPGRNLHGAGGSTAGEPPRRSPLLFTWFQRYSRRYIERRFHALRLSHPGRPRDDAALPLVVYLNHPSWWDPLVCIVLTRLFPHRTPYAPMDAAALRGYRFFEKLGFFPVEAGTMRGAAGFLRTATDILSVQGTAVWVTAQGRFVDPRERPIGLRPGVAHLARRLPRATFLPLALEYIFWNESRPEILARFGEPVITKSGEGSVDTWLGTLEARLAETQDRLAAEALARDPAAFETICRGRAGIGGVYDAWRRLRARLRGQSFDPSHGSADQTGSGGAER